MHAMRHARLKKWFPGVWYLKRLRKGRELRKLSTSEVFTRIYERGAWVDPESRSGPGSNLEVTTALRRKLPTLLSELGARSFLDIPCGDLNWMQHVDLGVERYIGADIVQEIVDRNTERFADPVYSFVRLDLMRDPLPRVDVVFCRDCLQHLQYADIFQALKNLKKSGSAYLLTTTYPGHEVNLNIVTGQWRALDMTRPPIRFPEPLKLLDEESASGSKHANGKSLGLWRLADLR